MKSSGAVKTHHMDPIGHSLKDFLWILQEKRKRVSEIMIQDTFTQALASAPSRILNMKAHFSFQFPSSKKVKLALSELIGTRILGQGFKTFTGFKGTIRVSPDLAKHLFLGIHAAKYLEKVVMIGNDTGECDAKIRSMLSLFFFFFFFFASESAEIPLRDDTGRKTIHTFSFVKAKINLVQDETDGKKGKQIFLFLFINLQWTSWNWK
jgi:hypothetical protein